MSELQVSGLQVSGLQVNGLQVRVIGLQSSRLCAGGRASGAFRVRLQVNNLCAKMNHLSVELACVLVTVFCVTYRGPDVCR